MLLTNGIAADRVAEMSQYEIIGLVLFHACGEIHRAKKGMRGANSKKK